VVPKGSTTRLPVPPGHTRPHQKHQPPHQPTPPTRTQNPPDHRTKPKPPSDPHSATPQAPWPPPPTPQPPPRPEPQEAHQPQKTTPTLLQLESQTHQATSEDQLHRTTNTQRRVGGQCQKSSQRNSRR